MSKINDSPFESAQKSAAKIEAHSEAKAEAPSLSSQALDYMKAGASHIWADTKNSWSNIASGKGSLTDYGFLAAEGGLAVVAAGGVALCAAPEMLVAGGVAAIGSADAVGTFGAAAVVGGAATSIAGMFAIYEDLPKRR